MNGVKIEIFTWDLVDVNSYLISVEDKAVLIDVVENESLFEAVMRFNELTVVLTHCHYDHIAGLNHLREIKPDVKVCSTSVCSDYIGDPNRNLSSIGSAYLAFYLKRDIDSMDESEWAEKLNSIQSFACAPCDITFEEEMTLELSGHSIRLIRFFGHSNDSLAAILDGKIMFSDKITVSFLYDSLLM